jgi:hypothetical protein
VEVRSTKAGGIIPKLMCPELSLGEHPEIFAKA